MIGEESLYAFNYVLILKGCEKIMLNVKCTNCGRLLSFSTRMNDFAGKNSSANTICTNCGHLLTTRGKKQSDKNNEQKEPVFLA